MFSCQEGRRHSNQRHDVCYYAYTIAKKFQRDCEAQYSPLLRVAVKMKVLSVGSLQLPDVFAMVHFEGKCWENVQAGCKK